MSRLPGEGPHPMQGSQLFGRYDKDPGRYRPQYYYAEADVPVDLNGIGRCSIPLSNYPFAMTRMTHKIVGDFNDPTTTGLYQDALYDVEWKDEQHAYTNVAIPADLMWGWNNTGYVLELPFPIAFPGNKTLSFTITNRIARVLVPAADYFKVGICCQGIIDKGPTETRSV